MADDDPGSLLRTASHSGEQVFDVPDGPMERSGRSTALAHNRDVARFERWSTHYDRSILQRLLFAPVQEAAITEAALFQYEISAVVDLGCGSGRLLRSMARRLPDADFVGIDAARGLVRQVGLATPPLRHIEFVNACAESSRSRTLASTWS